MELVLYLTISFVWINMKRIIYRGYKIEESIRKDWGWNVYMQYGNGGGSWYWLNAYPSIDKAKEAIDKHFEAMEG